MLDWLTLLLFYAYGIPLFIINTRTVYVLWTQRTQFSSNFYKVFFFCSLNDCLLYLLNNYIVRLPSISLLYNIYYSKFDEFSRWQSPIFFLRRYCSYSTSFGCFLLSVHRLTAVWIYQKHEKITFFVVVIADKRIAV